MCTSASDGVADTSQGSIQSGMLSSDDTLPEYVVSENGIELTALGRHQVMWRFAVELTNTFIIITFKNSLELCAAPYEHRLWCYFVFRRRNAMT